ncbi:MAG: leucine-rich repeat domain-containing protein [Alphaproteobacteria bacterium]|nr:leucine-rich repeat domain-containing protein [Alphaproteobacteria bacterium]
MKKMIFILIYSMILSLKAQAQCPSGYLACGDDCGTNCSWSITEDGILSVWGNDEKNSGQIGIFERIKENGITINTTAPWGVYINNIKNIEIQEGITNLGRFAFNNLESQNPIEIPSSVTSITQGVFYWTRTPEVIIPNSITKIDKSGFGYSSMTQITLPDSLTTIGDGAFRKTNLTSIEIPETVTSIGSLAFDRCYNLQSVILGENVTSIGADAFLNTSAYIYCQEGSGHGGKTCAELVQNSGIEPRKLKIYTIENGKIKVGSKIYNSLDDLPKYTLKRIYTLEEANEAAGSVNRVSIRYR